MTREDVYLTIDSERAYQLLRWGVAVVAGLPYDTPHTVGDFIALAEHYLMQARARFATEPDDKRALDSLRKVAAILVCCGEQHTFAFRSVPPGLLNARTGTRLEA